MSFFRVNDNFSCLVPVLSPVSFKFSRKLGIEGFLDFSGKEHRFFQRRTTAKGVRNGHENLEVFKEIIERSLLSARGNKIESKDSEKSIGNTRGFISLKERVKNKERNDGARLESVKRFMSVKPAQYRKDRVRNPIFNENVLMIVNNHNKKTSRAIQKKYSAEFDEDKMDSKIQLDYLKSIL